ncbi:unnamed protein product [Didymodactylos carnosus]|uniref:Methyltransferase FkbM domain-containing protein n=2 Tax=Didymodactylos carnosus TaxID=1234261 RepID=A0A814BVR0_9BILA|nr:unnamed protein product [Didymodactylos carnosus]CAF3712689.1 unnamed protein product [Didymodactylos carnosus]
MKKQLDARTNSPISVLIIELLKKKAVFLLGFLILVVVLFIKNYSIKELETVYPISPTDPPETPTLSMDPSETPILSTDPAETPILSTAPPHDEISPLPPHNQELPTVIATIEHSPSIKFLMVQQGFVEKEPEINAIFLFILKNNKCRENNVILDVGMNAGYYSLLVSAFNCNVISFDPQARCHELYNLSRLINKFTNQWKSYENAVWFERRKLRISNDLCDVGYMSVDASRRTKNQTTQQVKDKTVQSVSIDSLAQIRSYKKILIFKIDTEGAEIGVLLSSQKLLARKRVEHFIIEIINHDWEKLGVKDERIGLNIFYNLQKDYIAILLNNEEYSAEILGWPVDDGEEFLDIVGSRFIIPEGENGFPILLENRKHKQRGCNVWFRKKKQLL